MRTKILVLFKEVFSKSDFATKGLQSINVSVTDTMDLIENLKQSLTDVRASDHCNSEFLKMLAMTNEIMGDNNIDSWDISLPPRSRTLPSRFRESTVTVSLGKSSRVRRETFKTLLDVIDILYVVRKSSLIFMKDSLIKLLMTSCTVERVFSSVKRIKTRYSPLA